MANATPTTKKKLYATRDFNDAGTEQQFKAGDEIADEKLHENYLAAGLASEAKPEASKEAASAA